ncbi:MAG: hypothetical protein LCH96_09125 [Actinobacteria bacterium]|nr:hypothetical protein [Actinomycetota bacterium]
MGWFRSKDDAGAARDPELPLSVTQAQRLRELVRVAWARAGREVTVHPDHVVDASGGVFGLWNLAVLVADAPERNWPGLVADHVARLAAPNPSVEALSDAELRAQLVVRLADGAAIPDPSWFPTAPTLAGDVLQLLVLDFPQTVITPREDKLAARGDLDEWRAVGRGNLWQMMRSEPRDHEVLAQGEGGHFDVLLGKSLYTASMALFLPELISMVGRADQGQGVLVALPIRRQVAFRVVDGPQAALGLHNLFLFAMAGYDEGAGPLSPHVFWVKDGHWEQVTRRDEESARVVIGPALAEALGMPDQ